METIARKHIPLVGNAVAMAHLALLEPNELKICRARASRRRSARRSGRTMRSSIVKVQLQTDPVAMPVEDVSVEWDEAHSVPVTVATLVIPTQHVDLSGELAARCEALSFNPWHSLAEHRPLGGMNRLRRVVYLASAQKRGGNSHRGFNSSRR